MKANCCFFILNFFTFVFTVYSSWWSLAVVHPRVFKEPRQAKRVCVLVPGLTGMQRKLCRQKPDFMMAVTKGAHVALKSCKRLFVNHRWNCPTVERSPYLFGRLSMKSHKETAFLYALFSASLLHTVTKACTSGLINNCYCHRRRKSKLWASNEWMGCNDDLRDGIKFSKIFLDKAESSGKSLTRIMNKHNIGVGRKVVMGLLRKDCKCHGVSGSCGMQICRKKLKRFFIAARILKKKYNSARMIGPLVKEAASKKVYPREIKRSTNNDLVYLNHSPDYCSPDPYLDIPGTGRRLCKLDGIALDSCGMICCGRGYDTFVRVVDYRCQCKFNWCCNVTCSVCQNSFEEYACKV